MTKTKRRRLLLIIIALLPLITAVVVHLIIRRREGQREVIAKPKPEAPPDLEKLRPQFVSGLDALNHKRPLDAAKDFASFNFGRRSVEEYRLLFLADAYRQAKNTQSQRVTLAQLWARNPRLVSRDDAGNTLGALYEKSGDFTNAGSTYANVAFTSRESASGGPARWHAIESSLACGDLALLLDQARLLVIKNPRDANVPAALDIIRTLTGVAPGAPIHLTQGERLDRAVGLMRDGDPESALSEMNAIGSVPADLTAPLQLNRGLAMNQLHQNEASNKVLDPLAGSSYRIAIPAIYHASKNYRALADSINPIVIKTIVVRQKVGTVRVRVKGTKKLVTKPKFANVKKQQQLVDLAKKAKKDEYDRLATERLKDLLKLPLANEVRYEVLSSLIERAEAKNQDEYEKELVNAMTKLDPNHDFGLQHFWDKAWAAYTRGDFNGARDAFTFIFDTYAGTNARRQSRYWFARATERLGRKEEAQAIYREIANAPYQDLYVINAVGRGAPQPPDAPNPLKMQSRDWRDIAEEQMPGELRLAYELTALSDARDARIEIQKNLSRKNEPYADALLGDLYNADGNMLLMMRALRRAYPQLGSVSQDSVPPYFLKMYHPMRYQEAIRKNAERNGLDPYLVMGLIHQESYYNPHAQSAVGAHGLMQLMPPTAKEIAARLHSSANTDDPNVNIKLGTFHFRQLVNLFSGNTQLAVASYNAGQGNVAKWRRAAPSKPMDEFLESIPFPETRNYVKRVTMLQASYRRLSE
jgi:soluble lytic murein transglycosylase-like protein